jgi:hypothetical protein
VQGWVCVVPKSKDGASSSIARISEDVGEGGDKGGGKWIAVVGEKSKSSPNGSAWCFSCLKTTAGFFVCREGSQQIFLLALTFLGASTQVSCKA